MELRLITPDPEHPYYEGMLAPGILVEIKPDPPSIYWDWTLNMGSRATAQCGIIFVKGRSANLGQAHKDVLQAAKLFPRKSL